jgi:electron transfer flavoprotein alpha subunit
MSDVLVYAQIADGAVHDVSLQCLAKARQLAGGGKVVCLVPGSDVQAAAAGLFGYGADEVHAAEDANLSQYVTAPFKKVVKDFLGAHSFGAVLFPSTTVGDDLAPILAAELGAACVLHCDDIADQGGTLVAKRLEFDRKVATSFAARDGATLFATLKDGAVETPAPDTAATGTVQAVAVALGEADLKARVLNRDVATKTVNLKDARIIVGAGAGVGSKENFESIKALAAQLGAEIGATRAVVDAGWLPADHQIGQTGATVRPDLYVACGISGAVQHWVGISEAKTIIAINTDKNAPLMKRAHFRITGDLNEVVPKLTKLIQA